MTDLTVPIARVLTRATERRNQALDEADQALAMVDELLEENTNLKEENAKLKAAGSAGGPASPRPVLSGSLDPQP